MEEEKIVKKTKIKTLPGSSSTWSSDEVADMNFAIVDSKLFEVSYSPKDIYLECLPDDAWGYPVDIDGLALSAEYKTLVAELKDIYDSENKLAEKEVDSYSLTLLNLFRMNDYPLSIKPQYKLTIKVGKDLKPISAVPDFLIRHRKSSMLLIFEDKTMDNSSYANDWNEPQIMGEIFVAAHNIRVSYPFNFYAIRIIGRLFTFYRVHVTGDYIKETLKGLPQINHIKVHRDPSPGDDPHGINAYDFCKLEDRKTIVEYIENIKAELSET
jgi:hypothetical protein